ncbi:hypothetical protein BS17DRAFT_818188 [Gyrodon lividus]|nr:hypothetical protein BS17DRAFT_818188 [Gyrodon lividus]
MNRVLIPAIEQIPYNSTLIRPSVEMNVALKLPDSDFNMTPNIAIILARQLGEHLDPQIVFLGECAFSQKEEALMKKLQLKIDANLEIIMVMMINIKEDTLLFKEIVKMKQMMDGNSGALGPVTVADHSWCWITQVDYYVWVGDGEKKINIRKRGGQMTTHGVDMQAVDVMISEGLVKIWDAIICFSKQLNPNADTDSLEAKNVPWGFDWQRCQISITNAAERTAHQWLQTWYADTFRGTKHSIDDVNTSGDYIDTLPSCSHSLGSSWVSLPSQPAPRSPPVTSIVPANRSTPDHTSESASHPLIDRSTPNPTVTDPLTTNTSSTSHKALDVEFFFQKEKEITICKPCKSIVAELAEKGESYNVQYHFSPKMSNTTLRYHMEAKSMKTVFKSLKRVVTQPGVKLDDLPPPPPDPSDHLPMGVIPSQKQGLGTDLPPFSVDGLKDYIIH